jgi:hypothetical protein
MRGLVVFCALVSASLVCAAQQRLETPLQPVSLVADDSGRVHVLCSRTDVDFDSQRDTGDAPAAWVVFDAASKMRVALAEFPWVNLSAARHGFSAAAGVFDFCTAAGVKRYSAIDQQRVTSIASEAFASVWTSTTGDTVWLAEHPSFSDPGTVVELHLSTQKSTTYPAGVCPQAARPFSAGSVRGIAFINEGTFGGADDGTLDIYVGQQRTTVDVGDTPNHLLIHDGRAYVTVNGSHHIIVVDLAERKVIDTIKTGTSGYDGPRESAIDTKDPDGRMRLYVTTFTGDVRIFDLATGQRTGTLAVGAKPEGLAIIGRELWVTRTFVEGGYAAARDVVIFDLNALTSVRENIERKAPSAYLAVGGSLRLPFELQNDATLTDLAGKTTRVSAVVSDAQTLDCRHLTSGVYALRSGQHSVTVIR